MFTSQRNRYGGYMKIRLVVLTFLLSMFFACLSAFGATYYVSPNGNDNNSGMRAYPWRTIQKAANVLVAGDTVYIMAGTYNERVMPQNSGASGQYITIASYPGEQAIIDGTNITLPAGQAGLLEINGRSYIKVSGLKIMNAKGDNDSNGILVNQSENITLENNYTYNTRASGIGVWNSKNITIDGNEIVKACTGPLQESLSVGGTDTFEIKNNKVHDTVGVKEGIDAKDGSRNGKIFKNLVYNVPRVGIYVDAWNKLTSNIEVFQNISHDNGDGIFLASEMGGTLQHVKIYDNLVYNNGSSSVGIVVSNIDSSGGTVLTHPIIDVQIINNTVYHNGGKGWGGGILVDNPSASQIVIRNNIVSQSSSFQIAVSKGISAQVDHNLIDGYRSDTTDNEIRGTDYIEGDPLFVNAEAGDFHLQKNSPAIDKGIADSAPSFDFDGRSRPQDAGYDIGAFEFVVPTNVEQEPEKTANPAKHDLEQNYPNPFNPSTTIEFQVPSLGFVSLKVYDVLGRKVATLVSEELSVGRYKVQWDASGFASGVYFYQMQAGAFVQTKKLLLLR